jgi:drug/metabolite transporter (DMT)-like permease
LNSKARLAFTTVAILWGIPYLLIKIAVDDGVPPAFVAWARVVLGAAVLLALSWKLGVLDAVRGRLKWLLAFAVAEIVIPFPLIAAGERNIDSSVAAILIAAAPLFVALLALRFDHSERVSGWRLGGLFLGFAGVILFVGVDIAGRPSELYGAAAVLASAFCYAVGPMILKRHLSDLDSRISMGATLVIAAILLAPAAAWQLPRTMPSNRALLALVGLGLLCTAVALVSYGVLVREAGPARALVVTYINPVIAVIAGVAVRGEHLGASAMSGLALILVGSWLSTEGPQRQQSSDSQQNSKTAALPPSADEVLDSPDA